MDVAIANFVADRRKIVLPRRMVFVGSRGLANWISGEVAEVREAFWEWKEDLLLGSFSLGYSLGYSLGGGTRVVLFAFLGRWRRGLLPSLRVGQTGRR
jgi:hypothetical protein